MSIGAGIALFVIGAVLTFATDFKVAGINIDLIGEILMGAGALVFVLGLIFTLRGRTSRSTVTDASGQQVTSAKRTSSGV